MKNIVALLLITFSFGLFAATNVGIVNMQKILTSISEGKQMMTTLEKAFKTKQKELKGEEEAIKKLQADFQKQNLVLSDKAKAKKEGEIRKRIGALQQKTMRYQQEIQKMEAELKKPILMKLQKIIDKVSKNKKVDLTFELATAPILYAKDKVDLTSDVIKDYDKEHPSKN